mmetsp:Transcript_16868/g.22728  ORF Transcript_16868/g.22728 Transcript_16868/m.22728 type:complete len:123 (+) Transcript_16868:2992-3360(+)
MLQQSSSYVIVDFVDASGAIPRFFSLIILFCLIDLSQLFNALITYFFHDGEDALLWLDLFVAFKTLRQGIGTLKQGVMMTVRVLIIAAEVCLRHDLAEFGHLMLNVTQRCDVFQILDHDQIV